MRRVVQVEQRETHPVDRTGRRAVGRRGSSTSQPSLVSSGGGPRPILPASHHAPSRASRSSCVVAPVAQVGRVRDPHVRAAAHRRRPMDHRPAAVDPAGEEGRVLVLGRHHRAELADLREVVGHRQRDERAAPAVGGVGDGPVVALRRARSGAGPRSPRSPLDALGFGLRSAGSGSKRQSVTPSLLRATCRWEMPRRSSTRRSRSVSSADQRRARVEDRVGAVGHAGRR